MRGILLGAFYLGFITYSIAWLIVALASDPTWWWFVPIYGDFKIFQASVWYELFHVGVLPLVLVGGALLED